MFERCLQGLTLPAAPVGHSVHTDSFEDFNDMRITSILRQVLPIAILAAFLVSASESFAADKKAAAKSNAKKKPAAAKSKITFDEHVKPIFRTKCFSCHNTSKKNTLSLLALPTPKSKARSPIFFPKKRARNRHLKTSSGRC